MNWFRSKFGSLPPPDKDFFHNLNFILRNLKNGGKIWIWNWKCERLNQRPKEWETTDMNCYVLPLGMALPFLLGSLASHSTALFHILWDFWYNLMVGWKWISMVIKPILFSTYIIIYSTLQTCISHVFLIPPNSTFLCMIWNDLHVD